MSEPPTNAQADAPRVNTRPDASDPALRGRTYAIPFETVWSAALLLAAEQLPRWEVSRWNDRNGTIQAYAKGRFSKVPDDVRVRVRLDDYGQTRLDLSVLARKGPDAAVKRIQEFITALDAAINPEPGQVLDPGYADSGGSESP